MLGKNQANALGTWWFLRQARARLDKTEHINRSQGQVDLVITLREQKHVACAIEDTAREPCWILVGFTLASDLPLEPATRKVRTL